MSRLHKVKQTWIEKARRFFRVNLFVQKVRYKTFGGWYWVSLFNSVLSRIHPLFDTFMIGLIFNEIQLFLTNSNGSLEKIYWFVGITVVVRLLDRLFSQYFHRMDWYYSTLAMGDMLDKTFMDKLIYLNWEHIENPKTEKYIHMTFNRALDYIRRLAELHFDVIVATLSLLSAFLLVKAPLWIIGLTLAKELPSIFVTAWGARLTNKTHDETQFDWIKRNSIFAFFRDFSSLMEIKIAQGQNFLWRRYDEVADDLKKMYMKKDSKLFLPWFLIAIYETAINAGVLVYYLFQVLFHGMLLGTFQYTTGLIGQIGSIIYRVLVQVNNSVEYYRYVNYAYKLLTQENERPDGTLELATDKITIEFKDVWFKYPGAKKYTLRGVNLKIEDNARLAIVGENGAGKSTFLKLLNRLYVPTKGQILVNGVPTSEYSSASYNKHIAVVTQDFARYSTLTVAQNIAIYSKTGHLDLERIYEAAKLADANKFIEKLPFKYNTLLTKKLENGTELSTGQWQRIAVARQFYANRPLVILDEPTSAIDPLAEAKIFDNLYEHVKDKTVIVVSHRYNTVRAAQRIIVINDGQIIEQGTHEELIALNKYYAKAFSVQQEEKKL